MKYLFKNFFVFVFILFSFTQNVFAAAQSNPFGFGQVLDPGNPADPGVIANGGITCAPIDSNCYPGLGNASITPTSSGVGELKFSELAANGSNYVGFKAPDAVTANVIWTLPSSDGTLGQVLRTNGAGILSWVPPAGGGDALVANPLSQFASTTSTQLIGVISDETGTGSLVFGTSATLTSATLVTPNLGTPSALVLTNATGLSLTTGVTGILPIANGGTGSATQNFVDLTTAQTVAGAKTFSGLLTANANVTIGNGTTSAGILTINEDTDNGTNKVTITVPALAADYALTLPVDDGTAGQVLSSDGSGVLSWISAAADTNLGNTNQTLSAARTITSGGFALTYDGTGDISFADSGLLTSVGLTSTGANTFSGTTSVSGTNTFTVGTGATTLGGTLGVTGNQTNTGDLAVNGGDITTTATTFNLLNTTATTLNIGGAATTISVGIPGASGTLDLMGGSGATGCTIAGTTGDITCAGTAGSFFKQNGNSFGATAVLGTNNANSLSFETNNITWMTLDTSGNLGIGVTSPTQKLDVNGTVQMTGFKLSTAPTAGFILTSDATGVGTWQASGGTGTISGQAANFIPLATGLTTIGAQSALSQTGTGASSVINAAGGITTVGDLRGAIPRYTVAELADGTTYPCNLANVGRKALATTGNQGERVCKAVGTSVYAWVDPANGKVLPRVFGAIADGTAHPLSERYATLGAAQADFSFVTALTQQIDWAAIQKATDLAGTAGYANGVEVDLGSGNYYITDEVTIDSDRVRIVGNGKWATTITFAPTSAKIAFNFSKGAMVVYQCAIIGVAFNGSGTAKKTAIQASDVSEFIAEDIAMQNWTGNNSIGILLKGRELITFRELSLSADQPILIEGNPNSPAITADHLLMEHIYLLPIVSTNYGILVSGSDLSITNWKVQGVNPSVAGAGFLYYDDAGSSIPASLNWEFEGVRTEQAAITTGYGIHIDGNLQGLLLKNIKLDSTLNGIYLRGVSYVTIQNVLYDSSSKIALNVNSTVYPLRLDNFFTQIGSTLTMTGLVNVWKQDILATSAAIPANALYMPTGYSTFNVTELKAGAITTTGASTFSSAISSEYTTPLTLANDGTGSGTYRYTGLLFRDNISGPTLTSGIFGNRNNAGGNWYGDLRFRLHLSNSPTTDPTALTDFLVLNGQDKSASIGANGTTNPVFLVNANTASVATGVSVTGAAAGAGVTMSAISSGANENLIITGKGTGLVHVFSTSDTDILRLQDSDGSCLHNPEAGSEVVTCSSDARLKRDIIDAESALAYFKDFQIRDYTVIASGNTMTGVIAQEILPIHPELVSEDLTTGMYSVQMPNQWKVIKAIQELDLNLNTLADPNALLLDINNEKTFAGKFFDNLFAKVRVWLGDSANGIEKIRTKELCVGDVCVSEDQFLNMVNSSTPGNGSNNNDGGSNTPVPIPTSIPEPTPVDSEEGEEPIPANPVDPAAGDESKSDEPPTEEAQMAEPAE